jgi:hypothetical protein
MAAKVILSAPPTHSDGITLGESPADKAGLFGAAVVQPSGAAQAAVPAGAVAAAAGANPTKAEFDAAVTQINALTVLVNAQRAALVALGAIKGAA